MHPHINSRTEELIRAFMQFNKVNWERKAIDGYKPSEVRLLICIGEQSGSVNSGLKVSEISKTLKVTTPSVTQLLNKLEKEGLVERRMDEKDRRVVFVRLTAKGEGIAQKGKQDFVEMFTRMEAYLGNRDVEDLTRLLQKVYTFFMEKEV
ncbi:MAG: MarR family winged helix-turn-helix transcriptional regulator [Bacillus sp. (in: firmicutes)]